MRNYIVGINVETADELDGIGVKLRAFIDVVGDGTLEVQLAINPLGASPADTTHAIGFATEGLEYYEDDEGDEEDD